jgi:predicted flap endonuclease-1-like 5' DNA nuclease
MVAVKEIRGVQAALEAKLVGMEIKDSDQFLAKSSTPAARKELATKLGVDVKVVLELANRADLIRIKGVGGAFSNLLEEAGVDTVKELAARVPANLQAKLEQVNNDKKLTNRAPTLAMVTDWVTEAKTLPKVLEY